MTKVIRAIDTIDYKNDQAENIAQHEDVLVGWRGKWVKLDLSHDHFIQFDQILSPLMEIGDPVKESDAVKRTPSGRRSIAHGGRRTREYYENLVAWADKNRISKRDGSGRPAYAGHIPGRNDYPDWLIRMYDEHLEKEASRGRGDEQGQKPSQSAA